MKNSILDTLKTSTKMKASEIFTDREEPRKVFWNHFDALSAQMKDASDPSMGHAILYYGIGGIGKTTLLDMLEFEQEKRGKDVCRHVRYDFDRNKHAVSTRDDCIRKLWKQLEEAYGFSFVLTELASVKIAGACGDDFQQRKRTVNGMINESRVLKPLFLVLKKLPVVGGFVDGGLSAFDAIETASGSTMAQWFRHHEKKYREYVDVIDGMEANEIQERLHLFFAADLELNLEKARHPLVVMLDTYEQYVNVIGSDGRGNASTRDSWLKGREQGLVALTPKVLWVICGRDKLVLDSESDWEAVGLEEHLLGNLSPTDAKGYFSKIGMRNTALMEQLYTVTQGVPVFLDFCYEIFRSNSLHPELQEQIETYGRTPERIIDRYLQGMSENMLDLIKSMSCLECWTDELVNALRTVITGYSDETYGHFLTLSLVKQSDGWYFMHAVVRKLVFQSIHTPALPKRIWHGAADFSKHRMETETCSGQKGTWALWYVIYRMKTEDQDPVLLFQEVSGVLRRLVDDREFETAEQILDRFEGEEIPNELDVRLRTVQSKILLERGKYRDAYLLISSLPESQLPFNNALSATVEEYLWCFAEVVRFYKPAADETLKRWTELVAVLARQKGEDAVDTLTAMNGLAMCFTNRGDFRKGKALNEQCYRLRCKVLGEEHPDTLLSLTNLAVVDKNLGEYQQAFEAHQKCYAVRKKTLGAEHPSTLDSLNNLAVMYTCLGRYDDALDADQRCYEARKRVLGPEHPRTLWSLNNLAADYRDRKDGEKALELDQTCYRLRLEGLGEEHLDTMWSLGNLAADYRVLGRFTEALEVDTKCYRLRTQMVGGEHPTTLRTLEGLAADHRGIGDYQEALRLDERCYTSRLHTLGEDHPETKRSWEAVEKDRNVIAQK